MSNIAHSVSPSPRFIDRILAAWLAFKYPSITSQNTITVEHEFSELSYEQYLDNLRLEIKDVLETLDVLDRAVILGLNPLTTPQMLIASVETSPTWHNRIKLMEFVLKRDPELMDAPAIRKWCGHANHQHQQGNP